MTNETRRKAVSRRDLLIKAAKTVLGVTVVGVATPLLDSCSAGNLTGTRPVKTTFDVSKLTQDGQALVTKDYGPQGAPVLIVRQAAASYYALSMLCTHAACFVGAPSQGVMVCPCHGSEYNMMGQVLRGPAYAPLHQYALTYDATAQTVTLS